MYKGGNGDKYSFDEMIARINKFIDEEHALSRDVNIIIGCDSQNISQNRKYHCVYALAIAACSVGYGGIYFIKKEKAEGKHHISQKLFKEAEISIAEAKLLHDSGLFDKVDSVEIHVDAGLKGKSRLYAHALKAMVEAEGYTGKIKPDAFAAAIIADRYTK